MARVSNVTDKAPEYAETKTALDLKQIAACVARKKLKRNGN
jgi:hypothetical protein